jgi:cytochrome d ubiquinol oxidase subunit I
MDALDLARWQFGITTVYHFLFVPITIGLSGIVAWMHTRWVRHHREEDLRLTKFYGKLFTINFALGLVTGIVQEFQFGMNWSDYSRFVGDIFGAPLAVEALLAFFLESTFLGLWLFGWGRLPERLHAATMWAVHIGTVLSAYFILAANSFMQNPVGYTFNPETGRAEMTDFFAVLTNQVQRVTFPHTISAAYMTGGAFVMGVAIWSLWRNRTPEDAPLHRRSARIGAWVALVGGLAVVVTGDAQARVMTEVQPMKMAAAEALYDTQAPASFSILTIGSLDGTEERFSIRIPGLLSYLSTGSFDGEVEGINDIQAEYMELYGTDGTMLTEDGTYTPSIPATYWLFRLMIGTGMLAAAIAAWVLWVTRTSVERPDFSSRLWAWTAVAVPLLPLLANSFGWMFTEMGRQPWVVFGLMTTARGVSPSVSAGEVVTSMVVFTLLYGVLAVIEVKLLLTWIERGPVPEEAPPEDVDEDAPLVFAY